MPLFPADPYCPPVPFGFQFLRNKDIYGNDIIPQPSTTNIAHLAQYCKSDPQCKSFNSMGYVKGVDGSDDIRYLSNWTSHGQPCGGIYIKTTGESDWLS